MQLKKDDPRLMDFVLGELDPEEAANLTNALADSQNIEAQAEVAALRATIQHVQQAFEAEPLLNGLKPEQRQLVTAVAEETRTEPGRRHHGRSFVLRLEGPPAHRWWQVFSLSRLTVLVTAMAAIAVIASIVIPKYVQFSREDSESISLLAKNEREADGLASEPAARDFFHHEVNGRFEVNQLGETEAPASKPLPPATLPPAAQQLLPSVPVVPAPSPARISGARPEVQPAAPAELAPSSGTGNDSSQPATTPASAPPALVQSVPDLDLGAAYHPEGTFGGGGFGGGQAGSVRSFGRDPAVQGGAVGRTVVADELGLVGQRISERAAGAEELKNKDGDTISSEADLPVSTPAEDATKGERVKELLDYADRYREAKKSTTAADIYNNVLLIDPNNEAAREGLYEASVEAAAQKSEADVMQKNTVRQYTELSTKSPEGANATGIKQFRFTVPESIVIASGDSTAPPQVEVHDRSVTYGYSHLLPGGPADLEEKVIPYWFYHPGISPSAESYAPIVEKPFLSVAQQPLSTFGIDVDSASYSNVRRFIEQGQLPPPDAVRIEELINYFDYEYPEPTGTHPFSLNVETGVCPWAPEHLLAKIGLKAREVPRAERPLTNLVFLIDVSGSMQPSNKLPLVRESMKALLEALDERDRIAIVTYASGSSVALPSTPASDRATIATAIDRLHAGGSTHGSAGIQDAYRIARENFLPEGVNRVILATDGDFNVGVTDPDALVRKIEEQRQSGVFLTALGFGMGNLKDATLEQLADKGNGNYAYIDDFSEARKVLVEELMGTLVTVAKDVKIQVEFNPAQVQAYRLLGYENRMMAAQDFNDDRKDAGEIGAGHTVTALYEIVPLGAPVQPGVDPLRYQEKPAPPAPAQLGEPGGAPGTAAPATPVQEGFLPPTPQTNELMLVKLRYKQPDADNGIRFEQPVPVQRIAVEETSPDFRFAAAVAAFGLSLRHSQYAGNADLGMAQDLAQSPLNASSAMTSEERQERRAFADLVVSAKTLGQR